jgi:hypothetical protein
MHVHCVTACGVPNCIIGFWPAIFAAVPGHQVVNGAGCGGRRRDSCVKLGGLIYASGCSASPADADLHGTVLVGADLSKAHLGGADLTAASLWARTSKARTFKTRTLARRNSTARSSTARGSPARSGHEMTQFQRNVCLEEEAQLRVIACPANGHPRCAHADAAMLTTVARDRSR